MAIFNRARCSWWTIFLALPIPFFLLPFPSSPSRQFLQLTPGLPPGTLLPQKVHFIQGET